MADKEERTFILLEELRGEMAEVKALIAPAEEARKAAEAAAKPARITALENKTPEELEGEGGEPKIGKSHEDFLEAIV